MTLTVTVSADPDFVQLTFSKAVALTEGGIALRTWTVHIDYVGEKLKEVLSRETPPNA